jgi:hypothetical protein
MRESRTSGFVRGAHSNMCPYRDLFCLFCLKLSPSSPGLQGQERLIDPEIEEVLASSEDADLQLGLNNEIAVEAENSLGCCC